MKLEELRRQRAQLLAEAEGMRAADGSFKDEQTRAAFDAKMREIDDVDAKIVEAERAAPAGGGTTATVEAERVAAEAVRRERQRVTDINGAVRKAGLDQAFADDLVSRGVEIDAARAAILDKLAERTAQGRTDGTGSIQFTDDARDKFMRGGMAALFHRTGQSDVMVRAAAARGEAKPDTDPGEFRGMTLMDFARECLERNGVRTRGMDRARVVGLAFTHRTIGQSTSDFAVLLENTMHKMLQAEYALAADTHTKCVQVGTVTDFRAHNRYRMGMFGTLDALTQNGEFRNKAILDGEKELITIATKGNIIGVSRQMIINDDMEAFTRLPRMLGRAAKLSEEVDFYSLLALNTNGGPTMNDGNPLFHASHNNITTSAALGVDALDADRVALASQQDKNKVEYLDMRPAVLLISIGLGGQARVINQSRFDVDASNKFEVPNKVVGLFRDIVDTPRLSGTRRYIFADPNQYPAIEKAYLEGQTEPVLETKDGWRQDGAEMRVRHDYGFAAVDYRPVLMNAGA